MTDKNEDAVTPETTESKPTNTQDEPNREGTDDSPKEPKTETESPAPEAKPSRVKRLLSVWGPRVGVVVLVILAFTAGWQIASPAASESEATEHEAHAGTSEATIWTCSMHPQIQMSEPGQCPICGMDLIPITSTKDDTESSDTTITLSPRAKKLAEVRTTEVRRADTTVEVRLLGRLEYDETRQRTVTPWTAGRIDRLFVSNEGAKIGNGQVIAYLFSPEVYAAHQDLIQAKRQISTLVAGIPAAQSAAKSMMKAARNRLRLLGVSDSDLDKMARADEPWRNVKIRSNYGGTVLELLVHQGAYVNAGTPMFKVADLSKLWVQLDAYENDLARIEVDQKVSLRIDTFPGELFEGKVSFIDPVVDPRMRTAKVRVEVANKDGRLRPGMFAEAVLDATDGKLGTLPLVVPATAPLFTGKRSVVYVEVPNKERPTYQAREVRLGPRAGDLYPVVSGLMAGERVVTRGAFQLDSDLQIRGGRSMMTMSDDKGRAAMEPIKVPEAFLQGMAPMLDSYLALHKALSKDDLEAARKAFDEVAKNASSFHPRGPAAARALWKTLGSSVAQQALSGKKAEDMEAARNIFESVSRLVIQAVQRFGNPETELVRLAFCPMAAGSKGAFWLQRAESIENPYFGASMFTCGEVRESVKHGERISPHALHGKPPETKAPTGHQH